MTSLAVFPKLRRTLTDVMEDELYHVPNSPYTHSNNSNTSLSSIRHDTLLTIPDLPPHSQHQYTSSPQLSRVSTNDQMSFENSDIPVFSSYADPETVPIAEPQYESEPLLKFNEDLTLSLFEDSEGLMNWTNKLHVTPDQNNNQSWGEDLEEMVSDSEDEYFDTDWEEEEEAEKPRFGDLRRESMSVPSSLNNVPSSRASMKTSPMQHVPSITNTTTTATPIKAEEMTPSMTATPPHRLDLSHLTPNAQGLHQCQLTNPSTNQPCLKSFSRPYDLIRHQDTIHAQRKKIFRCIVCSGLYPQALYPDRYGDVEMMDVDSTGKKEKTFSRGDALSRHVRVKHELSGDEATRAIQWAKDNVEYV